MTTIFEPTPTEVWDTLKIIDVGPHTQVRNGLTYLSWTWAWTLMKDLYPDFTVEWKPVTFYDSATAEVSCIVRIGSFVSAEEFLPVMNPGKGERGARYESRINPSSRDITDAKKRCVVKCFALLGLGLYIYAGEDLPTEEVDSDIVVVNALTREVKQLAKDLVRKEYDFSKQLQVRLRTMLESEDRTQLEEAKETLEQLVQEHVTN